ncbi:MAG: hypothetical protein H6712_06545, partial [Myxococcales bacterium]|nr:hypothetical protein [Myxococcales bacterium]
SGSVLDDELTRTGAVLGTPAYMSPEQHRGRPADARSDQFSFCVALYEALYGRRPFEAPTLPALVQAVLSGELQSPPPDGRVPTWVHRLVVRGLSLEPERRWPSMQVLVQQLERDPSRARRRLWAGAGGATLVGLLGFGLAELRGGTAEPSCPSAAAEAESLWSEARQQRVVDAFVASNSPLADDTLTRVAPMLEAYAGALGQMREEACLSHRQGVHSDRLFDLRTACLDQRRAGLDELLAGLEHADAATVGNAAWAAASLPPIDRCADTEALTSAVPPPDDPAVARQVQAEREALASASSLVLAGSYDEARARMDAALRTAESLGHAPLVAEAQLGRGTALMESREHEPALKALSRALVVALRSGHDEVAVEALARRMWVLADPLRRPLEALGDDEIAEALLDKLERPTRLQWLLLNNRGVAQFRAGRRGAAEGSYREALRALGPEGERRHPVEHISTRFNLAMLLSTGLGEPAAAARELRSARDQAIELLGPDHPRVAFISIRLAAELVAAMQLAAASEELEAGLVRWTADEPLLRASLLLERANLRVETRRYAEAVRDVDEALALADVQALGSVALSMRANARIGLGEVEAGLAELREAIAVEVERAGPEHETVANAHLWAAYGLRRAGRLDEAVAELERAEAIFAGLGLDGPSYLGRWLPELVSVEIAREQLDRADAALARIVAAQDEAGFAPDNLYRLQLAKLHADLLAARGDRRAAAAAYESACAGLEAKVGPDYAELAACTLGHARALGPTAEGQALARRAQQAYRALGEGHAAELADAMAPWATEGEEIDAG